MGRPVIICFANGGVPRMIALELIDTVDPATHIPESSEQLHGTLRPRKAKILSRKIEDELFLQHASGFIID